MQPARGPPVHPSGQWWYTLDALQWDVQLLIAAAAFVAAAITFGLVLARRYPAAMIAVATGLSLFCGWAPIIAPLGEKFGI